MGPLITKDEANLFVVKYIRPRIRDKSIPVRHPNISKSLSVHHCILADDLTLGKDVSDYSIDIVIVH